MRKAALVLVSACLGVAAGILGVHAAQHNQCPTEDSCRIDYSHGSWHITRDIP